MSQTLTEGTNFLHVVLGDRSSGIRGYMDDTRTCALATPVLLRAQQLADLQTAEHETGHAIDILKGTSSKREQKFPDDTDYPEYLGEHVADTYATLRMASLLGEEGKAFAQGMAASAIMGVTAQGLFSGTALQHLTAPSIQQALDYAEKHDLYGRSPSDLFTLAQQLIQPLSQDDYHALKDHLQKPGAVQARSTAPDIPPVAQEFFAQQDAAKSARPQIIAQLKEAVPQPEPALKDAVFSFDPADKAQYVAMEKFNAARRDASCPPFADEVPRFLANAPQTKPSTPSSSTP